MFVVEYKIEGATEKPPAFPEAAQAEAGSASKMSNKRCFMMVSPIDVINITSPYLSD